MESAQAAVGSVGNPVTGLAVNGSELVVTFADGTTDSLTLPAGGGMGGVDQTARDGATNAQNAADAAQGEIDAHETSTHNTDSTARADAATAQGEIDAHEASTHNTDTTARANATSAQGAITAHEANHPSGLPVGTSQRRELKWNSNTSAWDAVSDVTTVYYGASAMGDSLHVAAALAAGLNTAGTRIATDSYMLYKGFGANVLRNDHLAALWAAISTSPVVFVLAPAHTGLD